MIHSTSVHLSARDALEAFQIITDNGTSNGTSYTLNGIHAESSFDGYSVVLYNDYCSLTVNFHNTMNMQKTSAVEEEKFFDAIKKLLKTSKQ